jgi:hypothetical protein
MKGVVAFYYIDDIVFIYREKDKALADKTIAGLKRQIRITDCKELKWFLGIYILRDRRKRLLWLSQSSYIKKVANDARIDLSSKPLDTPIGPDELFLLINTPPLNEQATRKSSL